MNQINRFFSFGSNYGDVKLLFANAACFFILFSEVHEYLVCRTTATQTCFIDIQANSTQDREQRWALLIDQDDRCTCTRILPQLTTETCGFDLPAERYWYTDAPGKLIDQFVWNTEKLKYLLGCPYAGKMI